MVHRGYNGARADGVTIDERIEALIERIDALTQSVELLGGFTAKLPLATSNASTTSKNGGRP